MKAIVDVNIDMLNTKQLLNIYQKHSTELKWEEKIRMGEIKKFAKGVIPKSRFIFDRYEVGETDEVNQLAPFQEDEPDVTHVSPLASGQEAYADDDYFSYFASHEQALMRPESNFKNLHELMTYLPIDYYILLQKGYKKGDGEAPSLAETSEMTSFKTNAKEVVDNKGQKQQAKYLPGPSRIPRSNVIMFNNLPVIARRQ